MKEARFFQKGEAQEVQCGLCPHHCRLSEGKTGVCRVRKNIRGTLYALTYGKVTSIALDPVREKNPCTTSTLVGTSSLWGAWAATSGARFARTGIFPR